jgi:uncharacterized membrane protein/protein-disulfide isomerase
MPINLESISLSYTKLNKNIPDRTFWLAAFVLASMGVANFVLLSVTHYQVHTDPNYISFCALSSSINCDTVSQSPYSVVAGLPVSVWGIICNLAFLALLCQCYRPTEGRRNVWSLLFLAAAGLAAGSLYFAFVSNFIVNSFCIFCIIGYGINFGLLFTSWIARRRLNLYPLTSSLSACWEYFKKFRKIPATIGSVFFLTVLLTPALFPKYWQGQDTIRSAGVPRGVTEEGDPWIGAERPTIEIIEYADYQCLQCRKMHFHLRRMIENNPDKLRLVHRQYPLDHTVNPVVTDPFHIGSGALALVAIYASLNGKFWEMNDALYDLAATTDRMDISAAASKVGLDNRHLLSELMQPEITHKLAKDIQHGIKLGIHGTPAYQINGQVFFGTIPSKIFEPLNGNR